MALINLPKLSPWNPERLLSFPLRPWARNRKKVLKNCGVKMRNRFVAEIIDVPPGTVFSLDVGATIFLFVV